MGWGDDQIAAYFGVKSPDAATVFNWVVPFALAALTLWAYHIVHLWPQNRKRALSWEREIGLLEAVWWVAEQSAWGRWKNVQRSKWVSEETRLVFAASYVRTAAINGDLAIRGRLSNSVQYEDISRDFWRSAHIDFQPYNSFWRIIILPLGEVAIPDYDGLIVERRLVEMLWPKHEWKYDWRSAILFIKAKLRSASPYMPEVEKKDEETAAAANKTEPPIPVVETNPVPVTIPAPVPAVPVVFTPLADAPEGWEKLYAIGDDGRSIWLHFLPDNKSYKRDALILIVFGHKVLRGVDKVRMAAIHAAVEKTIDNAPGRPFDENPWTRMIIGLRGLSAVIDRDYGSECVPEYLLRVGLAQGGMYQLTERGESHARYLAYDLISRA